jgi:hypothetical protein
VRHSDDFNHERATFRQLLRTSDGRRLSLSVQGSSGVSSSARGGDDARSRIAPGARVRVKGMLRGGRLVADASEIRTLRRRSVRASVTTQKKVAVILLNFQNNTAEPWTPDQVRGTVFTNANSVNAYFQEESSGDFSLTGKVRADGDVYGWYTVPHNNTSCSFSTWANAADDAATAAGVDLSGYDNHIYVWPTTSACWWAGLAYLPGGYSYINGYPDLHTISHELGHNYGLHHASSYSCTSGGQRVAISSSCTAGEYGDPFDTMGAGSTIAVEGGADRADDPAAAVPAGPITLSGLQNIEHLWLRGTGAESNSTTYTVSTNYTAFTHTSSTTGGGGPATNMGARGEFRIFTGTSDSTDPTTSSAHHASTMVALNEVSGAPVADVGYVASNAQSALPTQARFYWPNADVLILRKRSASITQAPAPATVYSVGATLSAEADPLDRTTVVYNGPAAATFLDTGLTAGTTYSYKVFAKTGSGTATCFSSRSRKRAARARV